jgi:hypothetical protein
MVLLGTVSSQYLTIRTHDTAQSKYSHGPISAHSVSAVSVNRGLQQTEKNGKLKK